MRTMATMQRILLDSPLSRVETTRLAFAKDDVVQNQRMQNDRCKSMRCFASAHHADFTKKCAVWISPLLCAATSRALAGERGVHLRALLGRSAVPCSAGVMCPHIADRYPENIAQDHRLSSWC